MLALSTVLKEAPEEHGATAGMHHAQVISSGR